MLIGGDDISNDVITLGALGDVKPLALHIQVGRGRKITLDIVRIKRVVGIVSPGDMIYLTALCRHWSSLGGGGEIKLYVLFPPAI